MGGLSEMGGDWAGGMTEVCGDASTWEMSGKKGCDGGL